MGNKVGVTSVAFMFRDIRIFSEFLVILWVSEKFKKGL